MPALGVSSPCSETKAASSVAPSRRWLRTNQVGAEANNREASREYSRLGSECVEGGWCLLMSEENSL